ncbi:hypothetical protein OBBRIDRAFT_654715 [Obba rivulosa]|uniref:Uncharacterized protein n=1 Tax=Obba rivulosa TaxID=1052685 RepID=A0A8E2AWW5_9APHY|nr:hypothetical protein OBBRIDRAFT_654715 [Obba rivulosa]
MKSPRFVQSHSDHYSELQGQQTEGRSWSRTTACPIVRVRLPLAPPPRLSSVRALSSRLRSNIPEHRGQLFENSPRMYVALRPALPWPGYRIAALAGDSLGTCTARAWPCLAPACFSPPCVSARGFSSSLRADLGRRSSVSRGWWRSRAGAVSRVRNRAQACSDR